MIIALGEKVFGALLVITGAAIVLTGHWTTTDDMIADLIAANGEARTTDIARRMGVAHPTASKTIARLKREGLARAKPYRGVFLTEAGAAMAKSARERHRLVVDLLIAVGAPREAAEADAEGIEHYVSASTLRAFEAFLRGRGEA